MAKSSINFAKASTGGFRHNDRSETPDYLLPEKFRLTNEVDLSAREADKKMILLYKEAKENYKNNTGQKLQAKSYRWEAVINLNKEHNLEDVKQLAKALEKDTGFTSVQIAIHRDEGRVTKDKQNKDVPIYNFHAHVTFFTLDRKTGINLYRKDITSSQKKEIEKEIFSQNKNIKRGEPGSPERKEFNKLVREKKEEKGYKVMDSKRLSKIQTLTAKSLNMVRGKVSIKEEAKRLGVEQDLAPTVRLGHREFKKVAQDKELVKANELKKILNAKREELKEFGAKRETYAKFEQISKELKEARKEKNLTHKKLNDAIKIIDELKATVQKVQTENIVLKNENKTLKQKYNDLKEFVQKIPNQLLENAKNTYKEILQKISDFKKENHNKEMNLNKEKQLKKIDTQERAHKNKESHSRIDSILEKEKRLEELYKEKEELQKERPTESKDNIVYMEQRLRDPNVDLEKAIALQRRKEREEEVRRGRER